MKQFVITLLLLCCFPGCHQQQQQIDTSTMSDEAKTGAIKLLEVTKEVYKTNWLATVFIIAIFAGGIAALNGKPIVGLSVVGSAIGSLFALSAYQAFASHPSWPIVIAIGVFLAAGGVLVWSLFIRNKGFAVVRKKETI